MSCVDVEPVGGALEQDVGGSADQQPGAAQDQKGDQQREQGVDRGPVGRIDDGAGDDRRDRAEQVAHDVQRGAPDVEVVAVAAVQEREGHDVDQQAQARDHEHEAALDRGRRQEAAGGLDRDPADHQDQRHAVDEGGQHLEAVVAVGAPRVLWPAADPERHPGERERGGVGQHVAGVGEQRQRARGEPAQDLDAHEARGQHEGPEDAALVVRRGVGAGVPGGVAVAVAPVAEVGVAVGVSVHLDQIRPS